MILYIDETENENFFIVAGVLFSNEEETERTYKQFKKRIIHFSMKPSAKEKVFTEFKGIVLEKRYQKIKKIMMEYIKDSADSVLFGMYKKSSGTFMQEEKEMIYIKLLYDIINAMDEPVDIVFDAFKINNFDKAIVNILQQHKMCASITPKDSQRTHGLQFIDNICGAIRLKQTGENEEYWSIISKLIHSV